MGMTDEQVIAASVDTRIDTLWSSDVLIPAMGQDQSEWIDVADKKFHRELMIGKVSGGVGVYMMELDWSNDATVKLITETIGMVDNFPQMRPVVAKYVRIRVRNTDPVNAFTQHITFVNAR